MPTTTVLFLAIFSYVEALVCHQCRGWNGAYPLKSTREAECDDQNNQCKTDFYCVQISNPMTPGVLYTTYEAKCWTQSQLQISPGNSVQVQSGQCYDYHDNAVPPKRYKYCFCNNADYCNTASRRYSPIAALFPLLALAGILR